MRRIQIILAVFLLSECVAVIQEANALAQRLRVTGDGDVLVSPWFYPSPFSGGLVLIVGMVVTAFLLLLAPPHKYLVAASTVLFVLGSVGLWSFHRGLAWMQGIGHGLPGWW